MSVPGCQPCPSQCESVFDRVVVSYLVKGGARIMWELLDTFPDPMPFTFQLQVGRTNNPDADDWEDVGLPVDNQFFAVDPEKRVWGKTNWTHYRVKLITINGTYFSVPTFGLGTLNKRDWKLAREIVRKERLIHRLGSEEGYLLKRRVTGIPCRTCLDFQTREVRDPNCASCFATGFECGYFFPMACIFANTSPHSHRTHLDEGKARGTVNDIVVQARMLLTDLLFEDDLFINKVTDDRYYIHKVDHIAEMRGVPLIGNVELRPIPFSSIIYEIVIPQQLAALESF